jgi:hypothetical protein
MIMENYKVYKSDLIINNPLVAKQNCIVAQDLLATMFEDSTWSYEKYNLFNITSSSMFFYTLYKEIRDAVFDFVGGDKPLWMNCWLNSHKRNAVLDWHGHAAPYHGFVVIDTHDEGIAKEYGIERIVSTTKFHNYDIHNELGNIYIGKGLFDHKVEVSTPYTGYRHTIAFNVMTAQDTNFIQSSHPLI